MVEKVIYIFRESFAPLRTRNFRIYLGGQSISLIGTWLQVTAQSWVVWQLSQSKVALGIVGMLASLPVLLLSPIAGVWADRLDRRKLLIGTQSIAMMLAFTLAVLAQTGLVQLWHVYVLAALLGTVTSIDVPAQQAFIGDLTGMQNVRHAVNLNSMLVQTSRMVGPAAAGFLIGWVGVSSAFWLNGLSFLAVIASLIVVTASQAQARSNQRSGRFTEGLSYLSTQPRLQDFYFLVVLMTFFAFPILQLLPAVADEVLHGDAQMLGLLMGASGAGALSSTLFLLPIAQSHKRPGVVTSITMLWMGIWFSLFSLMTSPALAGLTVFMGSLGGPIILTMGLGLVQVLTPTDMRARLISLFMMVSFGMQPIASLLIGLSANAVGTQTAILINGLLMIVGIAGMVLLRPDLLRWEIGQQAVPYSGQLSSSQPAPQPGEASAR